MRTKSEKISLIMTEEHIQSWQDTRERLPVLKLKDRIKNNLFLYYLSNVVLFPIKHNFYYSKQLFRILSREDIILNLGSGNKIIDRSIINVDQFKYDNVDILGDINCLPIKDDCVDGVINEVTLEHLKNPRRALEEMNRILKCGGYLCLSVPFLFYYHESPDDYHRWTKSGIILLLKENNFDIVKFENLGGPVGSFVLITAQVLAIVFSFNIKSLYHAFSYFFLLVLSPLYLLDNIFSRYSMASNASSIFLIIAKKIG
ncbi:MAG: hypothetical protein QG620_425 [Patescibacteria group bacterium]|nr:hypothetical protein [Patescibacteria group bacterium]